MAGHKYGFSGLWAAVYGLVYGRNSKLRSLAYNICVVYVRSSEIK